MLSFRFIHFTQRPVGFGAAWVEIEGLLNLLHGQGRISLHRRDPRQGDVGRSQPGIEVHRPVGRCLGQVQQVGVVAVAVLDEVSIPEPGLSHRKTRVGLEHSLKALNGFSDIGILIRPQQQILRLLKLVVSRSR